MPVTSSAGKRIERAAIERHRETAVAQRRDRRMRQAGQQRIARQGERGPPRRAVGAIHLPADRRQIRVRKARPRTPTATKPPPVSAVT